MAGSDAEVVQRVQHLLETIEAAAPEEIESALATIMDGAHADLREVASLKETALRLRLVSERHRWREMQLESLLDTAQQLLSSAATDDLIDEVVRAAARLLPCDVAHLSLGGDQNEMLRLVRHSHGDVSAAWRRHSSDAHGGITGLIFATNRPYASADYLNDDAFNHSASGDAAIREDGVKTMAGVPVRRGKVVIGALLASWRTPTQVSTEQLSLLGSLGALVSSALQGARLELQKRNALSEVEQLNEQFREVNAMLEWSADVHDRMTRAGLATGDTSDLAGQIAEVFGCRAAIYNADGLRVGTSEGEFMPLSDLDEIRDLPRETHFRDTALGRVLVCPATSMDQILCTLILDRDHLSDIERRTAERVAIVGALLLANERALYEARSLDNASTVSDLIAGGERAANAAAQARSIGLRFDEGCIVLAVELGEQRARVRSSVGEFVRRAGGLMGEASGQLAVLYPGQSVETVRRLFAEPSAGPLQKLHVGAAGPLTDAAQIPALFYVASRACSAIRSLQVPTTFVTADDLGFAGLLLSNASTDQIHDFVQRTIGAVIEYDMAKGTDLLGTVDSYFTHDSSLQRTASTLHVHSNTVYQRLTRVSALLGEHWQESGRRLEVQLAIRLHTLGDGFPHN